MNTKIIPIVLLLALASWCQGFNFDDLERINGSCSNRGQCQSRRGNRLDVQLDWGLMNCFCDFDCIKYGDCCMQAKSYDPLQMKMNFANYECVDLFPFDSFYMEGDCENKNHESYDLCRRAKPESIERSFHSDPFLDTPVTSVSSDVTYKNFYCAICNNETYRDIKIWPTQIHCPHADHLEEPFIQQNLQYINESWGFMTPSNKFKVCDIFPVVADTVMHKVRKCQNHVKSCSVEWTDPDIADLCHSYTTLVYGPLNNNLWSEDDLQRLSSILDSDVMTGLYAFKNYHCAICNYVKPEDISCHTRDLRKVPSLNPVSFSVLFDFGAKKDNCDDGQIWDPFSRRCRQVMCTTGSLSKECIKTQDNSTTTSTSEERNSTFMNNDKCEKVFYNQSEFFLGENETVVVFSLRETFKKDHYELMDEGVIVCLPSKHSSLMGWLTIFGLGLSCICLVIHLVVFALVPDLKNLSGKNLASLCVALLTAFSCFLASTITNTDSCLILASVMYYSFLASFTWMNVMAFDIWKTLQMATTELRVTGGKQHKKFFLYNLYAWLFPAIALMIVLYIDMQKPSNIPALLYPELGQKLCWFGQKYAILIYFAAPIAVIMFLNAGFFIHAVIMVLKTTQTSSVSQPDRVKLKLYLRLALLMGLGWISGIVGGFLQNEYLWYVFILLNAFQGLFILLGFTCTNKVRKALKGPKSKTDRSFKQGLASNDSNTTNVSSISSKSSLVSSP